MVKIELGVSFVQRIYGYLCDSLNNRFFDLFFEVYNEEFVYREMIKREIDYSIQFDTIQAGHSTVSGKIIFHIFGAELNDDSNEIKIKFKIGSDIQKISLNSDPIYERTEKRAQRS